MSETKDGVILDWFAELPGKGAILLCAPHGINLRWSIIQIKDARHPLYITQTFDTLEAAVGYVELML